MTDLTAKIIVAQRSGIIKSNADFYKRFYSNGSASACEMLLDQAVKAQAVALIKAEMGTDNIQAISAFDDDFPYLTNVTRASERPYLLFYRGNISLLSQASNVAVIGLTTPSPQTVEREEMLIKNLAEYDHNACVVSGLAKGCDTVAHVSALKYGLKTVAILPSTIKNIFPAENQALAQRIVETGGLIVTEYFNEPTDRYKAIQRFIDRDRLQAMFSSAVVMAASYRKNEGDSGSRYAMEAAERYGKSRYVLLAEDGPEFGLSHDYLDANFAEYLDCNLVAPLVHILTPTSLFQL